MKVQPNSILLADYKRLVDPTDKMPKELQPVLFGLFGEVGSVMATSKKHHREGKVYGGHRRAAVEEFGDVLWYLTAIGRRLKINIDETFRNAIDGGNYETAVAASDLSSWPIALTKKASRQPDIDPSLLELGSIAGELLRITEKSKNSEALLSKFSRSYLKALQASGLTFGEVARYNADKTRGRFLDVKAASLPSFDDRFLEQEQLPRKFEIHITERNAGRSYLQWNGVFLGDPLTDNILDKDGYRFHDVFHMAHAAVLHWSPVFRALIKHKRKSDPVVDEAQDGGRAIVIEEGLTAWIFSQAKETGFFAGRTAISFDILKSIQTFVAGYEVDKCPLKLWELAILQGYEAFIQIRKANGGILIGNMASRTLKFKPLRRVARGVSR